MLDFSVTTTLNVAIDYTPIATTTSAVTATNSRSILAAADTVEEGAEGATEGADEGAEVGATEGAAEGAAVEGADEGATVEGAAEGEAVEGDLEGIAVVGERVPFVHTDKFLSSMKVGEQGNNEQRGKLGSPHHGQKSAHSVTRWVSQPERS